MWLDWLIHGVPDAPKALPQFSSMANKLLEEFQQDSNSNNVDELWNSAVDMVKKNTFGTYLLQQTNLNENIPTNIAITNDISNNNSSSDARLANICRNDWYRLRRFLEIELTLIYQHQQSQNQMSVSADTAITTTILDNMDVKTNNNNSNNNNNNNNPDVIAVADSQDNELKVTGKRTEPLSSIYFEIPSIRSLSQSPATSTMINTTTTTTTTSTQLNNQQVNAIHSEDMTKRLLDIRCFFLTESREDLYRTIDQRCIDMCHNSLLEEVTNMILNNQLTLQNSTNIGNNIYGDSNMDNNNDVTVITDSFINNYAAENYSMVARAIGYRQAIDYLLYAGQYAEPLSTVDDNNNTNTEIDGDMGRLEKFIL